MKRICIISDTHGILPESILTYVSECDYCFHAGDIGDPSIMRNLKLFAPTIAVLGNNDFREYGENLGRIATIDVEGVHFVIAHYLRDARRALSQEKELGGPALCVHGHTHVPEWVMGQEAFPADAIMCPGALNYPRGMHPRSFVILEVAEGNIQRAELMDLKGNVRETWVGFE